MNKRTVLIGGSGAVVAIAGLGVANFLAMGSAQEYVDSVSKTKRSSAPEN